jgi:hypothetical protein
MQGKGLLGMRRAKGGLVQPGYSGALLWTWYFLGVLARLAITENAVSCPDLIILIFAKWETINHP